MKKIDLYVCEVCGTQYKEKVKCQNCEMYKYGMRLRGFSPFCLPMNGFIERQDDMTGRYHDILIYDRQLSDQGVRDYELDYLGEVNE